MANLTIKLNHDTHPRSCGLCGVPVTPASGPRLSLSEGADGVCRKCGRKHAPSLVALLDLAQVAERVGRIGKHTLVPPLNALLDLARAAEDYLHTAPDKRKQAA